MNLPDLIHQLRTSAPSLRNLTLSHEYSGIEEPIISGSASMASSAFFAALRNYSQGLEVLKVDFLILPNEFFIASLDVHSSTATTSGWRWPRLRVLELERFCVLLSPEPKLSQVDRLVALASMAVGMPALEFVRFEPSSRLVFELTRSDIVDEDRESPNFRCIEPLINKYTLYLRGFSDDGEQRVVSAWSTTLKAQGKKSGEISGLGTWYVFATD
jgi:hypothetical protein